MNGPMEAISFIYCFYLNLESPYLLIDWFTQLPFCPHRRTVDIQSTFAWAGHRLPLGSAAQVGLRAELATEQRQGRQVHRELRTVGT